MVTGERLRVDLSGGAPWGFRLQGGGNFPLEVAKIRKKSHAHESDLREGDVVVSINGYQMSGRSHQSAMDIVEMASDQIIFEVVRPTSGQGASRPLDPQRQPRIIPMVSGYENAGPGLVSSARANFTATEGNTRTDVHTEEFVTKSPIGKKITKTVTEKRITRYPGGLSPVPSHENIPSGGHISRSPNRSPLMWQPKSLSPAQGQSNVQSIISPSHSVSPKRSPLMWQPPSQIQATVTVQSNVSENQTPSKLPVVWPPRSASPSPVAPPQEPPARSQSESKIKKDNGSKENMDPILMSEQAKWEARHGPETVPKFKLDNFGSNTFPRGRKEYIPPKVSDPNYPMFEIPKTTWAPPKIVEPPSSQKRVPPPVPPKPLTPSPSPIPFDLSEQPVAGSAFHHPGMIRPPQQPNVKPAPPPPPMPIALHPEQQHRISIPSPKKFRPGHSSTPMQNYDEPDHHRHRPDHLPVFAPKVMFAPGEDSGIPGSPDRSEAYSDLSSPLGLSKKKLFSDSAFYEDGAHRYPTIDEQMSMCKKIAESLTSAANKRARGARMFMKRKRKANKWVHEHHEFGFGGSEYSSSAGDVADLNDLDTELYYEEGGRPLFSFRIPNLANQVSAGEKMSLSKDEFERLRLAAPRVDHSGVSPNMCFSIAADLHKGGKNKGAKLFQKRQQRVERFVIDESNVHKAPFSPTPRLEQIIQSPQSMPYNKQTTPWKAASQGNMDTAFDKKPAPPMQNYPRHNLVPENQPKLLEGKNFNKLARGWQSGPAHQQHSYYRVNPETHSIVTGVKTTESTDPSQGTSHSEYYQSQTTTTDYPDQTDSAQGNQANQYGDYNRRIKAWPGSEKPTPPQHRTIQSYSEQTNYNSLPRGFGMSQHQHGVAAGSCDL